MVRNIDPVANDIQPGRQTLLQENIVSMPNILRDALNGSPNVHDIQF
jgi:hypothetical protein